MHVCPTLGSTGKRWREKDFFKLSKEKKSLSRYMLRMHEGAIIQPSATEVFLFVKITNIINHANLGGCMLNGLVLAKGRI
jgi:hypothetical protein